jgi:hypothetical protein
MPEFYATRGGSEYCWMIAGRGGSMPRTVAVSEGLLREVLAVLEDNCTDGECDGTCTYGKVEAVLRNA